MSSAGGWRARRAVRKLAAAGTAESARRLAEVFVDTTDDEVRGIARQALTALAGQGARDAACEVAIATGDEQLRTLLAEAGHLPSNPERRALWLFLDGRFDEAVELDFDGGLLRAAYQRADAELRRQVSGHARAAGRVDWVRAVITEPGPHRLGDLTDDEWDSTVSVLTAARRWDELWRLALSAPLPWAARLLRVLAAHAWRPAAPEDHDGYAHLLALAERCTALPSAGSLFSPKPVLADGGIDQGGYLAVSRGGELLCFADYHRQHIRLWRLPSGKPIGELGVRRLVSQSLAIAPDASVIAISDYDGGIKLLSPSTGDVLNGWSCGRRRPDRLAFAPDGELLVGAVSGGGIRAWEVPSGRPLWSVRAHRSPLAPGGIAIAPSGRLLVTCRSVGREGRLHGQVRLWHLPSGEPAGTIDLAPGDHTQRVMVTPDGRRLVAAAVSKVHIWALPSLTHVATVNDKEIGSDVVMPADGKVLIGVRGHGDTVEVWRTADGEPITSFDCDRFSACLAVSGDGRLLLTAGRWDGPIHAWHLPSGESAGTLGGSADGAGALIFTPDGAAIAATSRGYGQPRRRNTDQVMLWRPEPVLMGRVPIGEVTVAQADHLRVRTRHGDDRPWGELLAALVHWRHRKDIEVGDAIGIPTGADIEVED